MRLARAPHPFPEHVPAPPPPAPLHPRSLPPLNPPAGSPLARRYLAGYSLSGTLPTQLGGLTALTSM